MSHSDLIEAEYLKFENEQLSKAIDQEVDRYIDLDRRCSVDISFVALSAFVVGMIIGYIVGVVL